MPWQEDMRRPMRRSRSHRSPSNGANRTRGRRRHQHQIFRHLPFGHPSGPQRMGQRRSIRWCPATRSPASSPRSGRRSRNSRSATASASAASSTAASACASRDLDREQYMPGLVLTYNSVEADGKTPTQGGYSDHIVVKEGYVLSIPEHLPLRGDGAAALRRHHALFAAAPLGRRSRQEGRDRRHGRAWPYGRQACARDGRGHDRTSPERFPRRKTG